MVMYSLVRSENLSGSLFSTVPIDFASFVSRAVYIRSSLYVLRHQKLNFRIYTCNYDVASDVWPCPI